MPDVAPAKPTPEQWKAFGKQLEAQRQARGLTKRAAARLAKVSDTVWAHLEKGERQIAPGVVVPPSSRPETIVRVIGAVGLPFAAARDILGPMFLEDLAEVLRVPANQPPDESLEPDAHPALQGSDDGLHTNIDRLPPNDRAIIKEMVERLLGESVD